MRRLVPPIVHYHIFKNAGSSVDRALQEYFKDRWSAFEGNHAHDIKSVVDVLAFLERNQDVLALSSHLARPPLPYDDAVPIVFLRHPIARIRSVHSFVASDPAQHSHEIARIGGLGDYIEWAFGSGREVGGIVIRNYQVVHLSPASFRLPSILCSEAREEDYEAAKSLLATWPCVGIADAYTESCQRFETEIKKIHDTFSFQVFQENQSSKNLPCLNDVLSEMKSQIGEDLYNRCEAENALDLRLYGFVKDRFGY